MSPTHTRSRDPWDRSPVGELAEQLLPRWFVLLALVTVPVAIAAFVWALSLAGGDEIAVAERRPPPAEGYTHAVGGVVVGDSQPQPADSPCPDLGGIRIAGDDTDRNALSGAIRGLCRLPDDSRVRDRLRRFADAGGVIRFALFERTGVDSTARVDDGVPTVLVNAKFTRSEALWIAPLVAHDVTMLEGDPASARQALAAREIEDWVCQRLLGDRPLSRACEDAAELLALPDPVAALVAAGYDED